ncbi:MAG: TonB-dependent receptor [Tidjanibacter sp.]|nr:TonB-dependent receptor [Tidjanibacter sp.]
MRLCGGRSFAWRRLCVLLGVLLFSVFGGAAQQSVPSHNLCGIACDYTTDEPLVGAVVEVFDEHSERVAVVTTNRSGYYGFSLPMGVYEVAVEYLGYENYRYKTEVRKSGVVEADRIGLKTSSITIDNVEVTGALMRTSIKGDTTVYNASAFKVAADADAHKMLTKMPGVSMDSSSIEVAGRRVRRVYVNGKEFFASDPMAAVKNIPADIIEYIETYYKLSENAELTGVDDGEGYMAINIITAEDKKNGVFGKAYAGVGDGGKAVVGGSINRLRGDRHIALIGLWNNINQFNFSDQDVSSMGGSSKGVFDVKPIGGVSSVGSFGINYNDRWGGKTKVSLYYFYNDIDNHNITTTNRVTYATNGSDVLYDAEADNHLLRQTHRFGGRIDVPLGSRHSISIRPSLVWQDSGTINSTFSRTDKRKGEDTLFVYRRLNLSEIAQQNITLNNTIQYRIKMKRKREVFAMSLATRYATVDYNSDPVQYTFKNIDEEEFVEERASAVNYQLHERHTPSYNISSTASYTRPISRRSLLSATYRYTLNGSTTDKRVYKSSNVIENLEECYLPNKSTVFDAEFSTHQLGMQYKYGKKKTTISGGLHYQMVDYVGTYVTPNSEQVRQSYDNVVYSLAANIAFSPVSRLKIDASNSLSNPSPTQLQGVLNTSNTQFLRIGNPELRQSCLHKFNLNYLLTNPKKCRSFSVSSRVRLNNSYIADRLVVDSPDYILPDGERLGEGNQFAKPENMRGFWDARVKVGWGMPLRLVGGNLNLRVGGSVGQVPSIINDTPLMLNTAYGEMEAVISSNISEYIDFTFSYNGRYNSDKTRFLNGFVTNDYLTHRAWGEVKYVTPHNFMLSTTAEWYDYIALGANYRHNRFVWNIFVGRKVLPRGLGEISVGVNDLFNQSAIQERRTIGTTAISEIASLGMGRYYLLKFVYNIRLYSRTPLPVDVE